MKIKKKMVNRPFKDIRPVGPIIDLDEQPSENTEEEFESLDDLPDSPMLREYVKRQAEYLNADVDEVINSKPVKDYMERLGVR